MFLGTAGYFTAHALKVWGLRPSLASLSEPWAPRTCRHHRSGRDPRQGHLLRDDHAGAVAIAVLHLSADAVHPRRRRHSGHSARILFGIFNLAKPTTLYYVILVGFLLGFLLIYRTINSPFGRC